MGRCRPGKLPLFRKTLPLLHPRKTPARDRQPTHGNSKGNLPARSQIRGPARPTPTQPRLRPPHRDSFLHRTSASLCWRARPRASASHLGLAGCDRYLKQVSGSEKSSPIQNVVPYPIHSGSASRAYFIAVSTVRQKIYKSRYAKKFDPRHGSGSSRGPSAWKTSLVYLR